MSYIGISPYLYKNSVSTVDTFDDISGSFNGSTTIFNITVGGASYTRLTAKACLIVLGGIVQEAGVDYTIDGGQITFTTAPVAGLTFEGRHLFGLNAVDTPTLGSVYPATLSTGGPYWNTSGNVGIGTINPTSKLTIGNSAVQEQTYIRLQRNATGGYWAGINWYDGTTRKSFIEENSDFDLRFGTNNTERMRITSGGYLKASNNGTYQDVNAPYSEFCNNTTYTPALFLSQSNTSFTDNVLFVEGYRNTTNNSWYLISAYNRTAAAYKFRVADSGNVTNTNGSYGTISSDIRLKENIINATSKLEDIMKLRVVNFNFIDNEQKQIGFIAQEMEEVFPSLVFKNDTREYDEEGNVISGFEDTRGLKVGMEFALLVKAIQELKAENDSLISRIELLENK